MFFVYAFAPVIAIVAFLFWLGSRSDRNHCVFVCAGIGAILAAFSPWILRWYTASILKDPTANIGAGLLMLGQVFVAPAVAFLGAMVGALIQSVKFKP